MVGQLDGDPLPARAVDGIVDGGFMELEWGAADAVRGGRQALGLDELPGIRPTGRGRGAQAKRKRTREH